MSRVLLGVIGALAFTMLWVFDSLQDAKTTIAVQASANTEMKHAINELEEQKSKMQEVADRRHQQWRTSEQRRQGAERTLTKARMENEKLRDHLGEFAPGPVIDSLLLRTGQGNACREGETESSVSDPDACSTTVTNERLYRWAGDLADGLLSCNADKAAIAGEMSD